MPAILRNSYTKNDRLQAKQTTDESTIRRMRNLHAGYLRLPTDTQYLILIAFPRQGYLRDRASILRYTYIASLVKNSTKINKI